MGLRAWLREESEHVQSITHARRSHTDDLDVRVSRYLLSMGIRTACVLLAVVVQGPWRWVFAVGAVVLPYIAVVLANAGYSRRVVLRPPVEEPPTVPAITSRRDIQA